MDTPWYGLMTNVAVVAFVVSVWTHLRDLSERFGPNASNLALGVTMGLGAIAAMSFPAVFAPGVLFDLRSSLIALAAFFGGPVAAVAALALAVAYRSWLGGDGVLAGLATMLLVALVALAFHYLARWRRGASRIWPIFGLAVATAIIGLAALVYAPLDLRSDDWLALSAGRSMLLFLAVLLSGLALQHDEERRIAQRENQTYRTIIDELPDSLNVKDLEGRFIAANPATARLLGVASPEALIGRTESEFFDPLTATQFRNDELAAAGQPGPSELQQTLPRPDGSSVRLHTLKVPLRDQRGQRIGVITHNRDITAQKRLELELDERQHMLSFAMAQMSDGVAMFDRAGQLMFCNSQYQELFPLTPDVRVPGAHIRDILAAAVTRGEQQVGASGEAVAAWIEEVAAALYIDAEEEVHLFNGSWLRVSTRPSPSGVTMVVVSDITRLKHTELELLNVTEQLRQEATTDALTGLMNRRAFDQRVEIEIARSLRGSYAISAILLDIDHFKAYNDSYGHQAGDECLKAVSTCVAQLCHRPADMVARFGGEEFVAILPETDEDAAFALAVSCRNALNALALPHRASPFGHVTISIGISSYAAAETERSAAGLIARADEAMYAAKGAGRDRINGWRRRFRVAPRRLRLVK